MRSDFCKLMRPRKSPHDHPITHLDMAAQSRAIGEHHFIANHAIMRDMRGSIVPVLESGGVDLLLAGHSHAYERSYLLDGHYKYSALLEDAKNIISTKDGRADGWGIYHKATRGPAPHEGTVYVVAGSSGQVSGGPLLHPAMYASLNILGSLVLDFDGPRLEATFIDTNAMVRDYFTVVKGSRSPTPDMPEPGEALAQNTALKLPARLRSLLHPIPGPAGLSLATNVTPLDLGLLLALDEATSDPVQKTNLTWALACIGDADVATNFLYALIRQHKGGEITQGEEDLLFETVQAIGLLAARYEAPFDFLKKHVDPRYFQTNQAWVSPRGHFSAGLLASCSIQALGLSGRPEIIEILAALQKKGAEYRLNEDPEYVRYFSSDIERAREYYDAFQTLGPSAFRRQLLGGQLSRPRIE
jgi:hypothetical protein